MGNGAGDFLRGMGKAIGRFNPGRPYDKAAGEADQAAQQSYGFGNQQWDRQMQGLGQAQGAFQPAQGWFQSSYGQGQPGQMQGAFNAFGGQALNQGRSDEAFRSFQQGGMNPTYGQQGYNFASQQLGGQTNTQGQYNQASQQLGQPGEAAGLFNRYQPAFQQSGAMEQFAQKNAGFAGQPNSSREVYDMASSQLYQPGRAESFVPSAVSSVGRFEEGLNQRLDQFKNLENNMGALQAGYQGANNLQSFAGRQAPGLEQKGTFEQFADSTLAGNNPYLERQRDKGNARINQEMARRGHFNSGGAATALGEYNAQLDAEIFNQKAGLARDAQQMGQGRLAQAQGLAGAVTGEQMGRTGALQGLYGAADDAGYRREGFKLDTAKAVSGESMGNNQLGLQAAIAADQSRASRLGALQGMASTADQGDMARFRTGADVANMGQRAQLDRMTGGMTAAGGADQGELARMMGLGGLAQNADQATLGRALGYANLGQGMDAGSTARYGMLGNLGQGADQTGISGYNAYMNAANLTGQDERLRQADAMDAILRLSGGQAGLIGGFYGQGGQLSGDAFNTGMGAQSNAIGLRAQAGAAPWEALFKGLGLAAKAKGAGV